MRTVCCKFIGLFRMAGFLLLTAVATDGHAIPAFAASGGEGTQELRKATAIESGDRQTLARLTSESFIFRTAGADRACEGRVEGTSARMKWLRCVHARRDIEEFALAMRLLRQAMRENPKDESELKDYLPNVVEGDGWGFHYQTAELHKAKRAFQALQREAGGLNDWTVITASWLYTSIIFRVQLDASSTAPRVRAVLVEMSRGAD